MQNATLFPRAELYSDDDYTKNNRSGSKQRKFDNGSPTKRRTYSPRLDKFDKFDGWLHTGGNLSVRFDFGGLCCAWPRTNRGGRLLYSRVYSAGVWGSVGSQSVSRLGGD